MRRSKVEGLRVVLRIVRDPRRGRRHQARLDVRDARVVFIGERKVGLELRGGRGSGGTGDAVIIGKRRSAAYQRVRPLATCFASCLPAGRRAAPRGRAGDQLRDLVGERKRAPCASAAGVELERERAHEGARLGLLP